VGSTAGAGTGAWLGWDCKQPAKAVAKTTETKTFFHHELQNYLQVASCITGLLAPSQAPARLLWPAPGRFWLRQAVIFNHACADKTNWRDAACLTDAIGSAFSK
jgi:hypothetical protein